MLNNIIYYTYMHLQEIFSKRVLLEKSDMLKKSDPSILRMDSGLASQGKILLISLTFFPQTLGW